MVHLLRQNLATQNINLTFQFQHNASLFKSRSIEEAFLLEVCFVQELLDRLIVIAGMGVLTSSLFILKDAKRPVQTNQSNADAVTDNHCHNTSCICRGLVCTERLWAYQIANRISNI